MAKDEYVSARDYQVEERANRFLIQCMLITFFLYTCAWILNILHVFIVDSTIMNCGFIEMICFIAGILIFCKILGYKNPLTKYVIMLFAVIMYSLIIVTLSYHVILICIFPLICSIQYSSRRMTIYTYVLTLIGIAASTIIGFRYGLCDANMLLLTTTTTAGHIDLLKSGDFTMNTGLGAIWLFFVFPRCMLTTAFIPILNRLRRDIEERAAHEAAVKRRAEIDNMTGLYNKNKYLDMVRNYYPKCEYVGVVFWDVNNLKGVNDQYGHECGDQLIAAIAESIAEFGDEKRHIFRVGGDEFVMICEQPKAGDIEGMISVWRKNIAEKTIEGGIRVSSAVGYAEGAGEEIENVIKLADEAMYTNKRGMKALDGK